MHIFYVPNIQDLFLDKEESQHCIKVLRLKPSDTIALIDGRGVYAEASITGASDKKTTYALLKTETGVGELGYQLHIAIAPTKNIARFEWFVEKAVEIGISEITPLVCDYSERKILKPERIEKIIVSACKQSLKARFPVLNPVVGFRGFIDTAKDFPAERFIAHCIEGQKKTLGNIQNPRDVLICIGPEGDFSPAEVSLALEKGFSPLSLGKSRLRTETAAVYCCSALNLLNLDRP
jgi:16S rRNA (uracil1498-N3)-methyltransferase